MFIYRTTTATTGKEEIERPRDWISRRYLMPYWNQFIKYPDRQNRTKPVLSSASAEELTGLSANKCKTTRRPLSNLADARTVLEVDPPWDYFQAFPVSRTGDPIGLGYGWGAPARAFHRAESLFVEGSRRPGLAPPLPTLSLSS
jgi:hypothetical protein